MALLFAAAWLMESLAGIAMSAVEQQHTIDVQVLGERGPEFAALVRAEHESGEVLRPVRTNEHGFASLQWTEPGNYNVCAEKEERRECMRIELPRRGGVLKLVLKEVPQARFGVT